MTGTTPGTRHAPAGTGDTRFGRGGLKASVAVGDVRLLHLGLGVGKPGEQIFGMYL